MDERTYDKIKGRITRTIVGAMLIPFFFTGSEYLYYRTTPHDHWFNYEKVESVTDEFLVGDKVEFNSFSHFYRRSSMKWEDILRCKEEGEDTFKYFSIYYSSNVTIHPTPADRGPGKWVYNSETPRVPSTCYLEANITLQLPYGISKVQKVKSNQFHIIIPNSHDS